MKRLSTKAPRTLLLKLIASVRKAASLHSQVSPSHEAVHPLLKWKVRYPQFVLIRVLPKVIQLINSMYLALITAVHQIFALLAPTSFAIRSLTIHDIAEPFSVQEHRDPLLL